MNKKALNTAIKSLKAGKVVAFPTETVFGLGAALSKPAAIRRLFSIKKRPRNKPLQILVASLEQAKQLGIFSERAVKQAQKGWPGPLTLVVYKTSSVPRLVTGGSNKVGLRVPDHRIPRALIRAVGPIVATSANISGEKPFLTAKEVKKRLPGLDHVLPGRVRFGQASRVIDVTGRTKILRA